MKSRANNLQKAKTPAKKAAKPKLTTKQKRQGAAKGAAKAAGDAAKPSEPMKDLSTTGKALGGTHSGYKGSGKKLGTTKGLATRRRQGSR